MIADLGGSCYKVGPRLDINGDGTIDLISTIDIHGGSCDKAPPVSATFVDRYHSWNTVDAVTNKQDRSVPKGVYRFADNCGIIPSLKISTRQEAPSFTKGEWVLWYGNWVEVQGFVVDLKQKDFSVAFRGAEILTNTGSKLTVPLAELETAPAFDK